MTSSSTYGIVTLIIDGVTSFLQLFYVQNVRKILASVYTTVAGNSYSLFKNCKIVIDWFIFFNFLCVRIEINSHWQ